MQAVLINIKQLHADMTLIPGDTFRWDPNRLIIEYDASNDNHIAPLLLLHEIGHAQLEHKTFRSDIDLLKKEVAAWRYAELNAVKYGVKYCEETAERCLDTYRAWLDQRSICPDCNSTGYQYDEQYYDCLNCKTSWSVSSSQLARVCRRRIN